MMHSYSMIYILNLSYVMLNNKSVCNILVNIQKLQQSELSNRSERKYKVNYSPSDDKSTYGSV